MACCIASIWYVPMVHTTQVAVHRRVFHTASLGTVHVKQIPAPAAFLFFLWVLPVMLLPWTPLFLLRSGKTVKLLLNRRDAEAQSEVTVRSRSLSRPLASLRSPGFSSRLFSFRFRVQNSRATFCPAVPAAVVITSIYVFGLVQRSRKVGLCSVDDRGTGFCGYDRGFTDGRSPRRRFRNRKGPHPRSR